MRDIYKRKAVYRRYSVISNLMIANTKSGLSARQLYTRLLSICIAVTLPRTVMNKSLKILRLIKHFGNYHYAQQLGTYYNNSLYVQLLELLISLVESILRRHCTLALWKRCHTLWLESDNFASCRNLRFAFGSPTFIYLGFSL